LNLSTGLTTFNVATTSNRLTGTTGTLNRTNSFDATGNLINDSTRSFTFNGVGRMATATNAGITTNYTFGQRIKKTNSTGTSYFSYDDTSGHLLGTYNQSGNLTEELVYLNDVPVATIRISTDGITTGVYYIHTDNLNAPRKLTRPSDNAIVWRFDSNPFGDGVDLH